MIPITTIRKSTPHILALGSYPAIIQSMLDFDFLSGKDTPSVIAIIASGRKYERYFWGKSEILIPVFPTLAHLPPEKQAEVNCFVNFSSARRVLASTDEVLEKLPHVFGGSIFAEDVPEKQSLELKNRATELDKLLIGPSSVGFLLPNVLKLGAIGGVDSRQLIASHLFTPGSVAVFSASGGMTGEIIRVVTQQKKRISFALSFGGDRFPLLTPREAFLLAEADPQTTTIVYFGELGGYDEYEIAALLKEQQMTKEVICYIAGEISEIFPEPPQFGHAKAMAGTDLETARKKREVLKQAGAKVATSFTDFVHHIAKIKETQKVSSQDEQEVESKEQLFHQRKPALITTSISSDNKGTVTVLGEELLPFVQKNSFGAITASLFLGRQVKSKELTVFIDFVLRLLVEHGPHVSGAVNTIVTARAGRDLVSSLASGLLTIGPRFGGAINEAAGNWLTGVSSAVPASEFVEQFALQKKYISGIGHRKYRIDNPDPRVKALLQFGDSLKKKRFISFAQAVEKETTAKKGNLILNVDGAIAAVMLDMLYEKEKLTDEQLRELVETEFFNAFFVLSRSVGFIAHFLDQKRRDEGLLRLDTDLVTTFE